MPPQRLVDGETSVAIPFFLLSTPRETVVHCELTEDRRDVFVNFSRPFEVLDYTEVLERLRLREATRAQLDSMLPAELVHYAMGGK